LYFQGGSCKATGNIVCGFIGRAKKDDESNYKNWKYVNSVLSNLYAMKSINQSCSSYADHQYNSGYWTHKFIWKVFNVAHISQQDSYSCGVFVMKVIKIGSF